MHSVTTCADTTAMCCHQAMLYVTHFLLVAFTSAKIVS